MPVLASAFGTFMGFVFAGLLALAITAGLDRKVGKERALLGWTVVLLLFTLWQCTPPPLVVQSRAGVEKTVPKDALDVSGDPFARPDLLEGHGRNPFQKHSDTRRLPPVELRDPPLVDLPFELPPTIPGPAPGGRRGLRGHLPTLKMGDGSKIPDVPPPAFASFKPSADDVYDWFLEKNGNKVHAYIRAIVDQGVRYEEGEPGFEARKWKLRWAEPGWGDLKVEYALITDAEHKLQDTDVVSWRHKNVSTVQADQMDAWFVRRSVANLYREALRAQGLGEDPSGSTNVAALRNAADAMAQVGRTGKEHREGWRYASQLLERALTVARDREGPGLRAEILQQLVEAYQALRDEQAVLRVLAEYARTSPERPEPWYWLGEVHLTRLRLPKEALAYFDAALQRDGRNIASRMGRGDALTLLGRHAEALEAYKRAGNDVAARVRVAEAMLRLGDAAGALTVARGALADAAGDPRCLLVEGAALYASGDDHLDEARTAFGDAATAAGDEGLEWRAQALYDLGLTCWRLGQGDAASAAFDGADQALRWGAALQRTDEETVSPSFGHALIALAGGDRDGWREQAENARAEAPRVAYQEAASGMVASGENNDAAAVRDFQRALALAGNYPELDGWLAVTNLRLGLQALHAGAPMREASGDLEEAVAFAARASRNEAAAAPKSIGPHLRECWVRIHAEHEPLRQRFEAARAVADGVLSHIDNEQPGALTLRGYCNFRLGDVDQCLRDFQQVLEKVPADDTGPWRPWRDYAAYALEAVKHWDSLEEKLVAFEGSSLGKDWDVTESHGVRCLVEGGHLLFKGAVDADGTYEEPTVGVGNGSLFNVGQFEELRMLVRIPTKKNGEAWNNVTFDVQVQRAGAHGGSARTAGIGLFYDKGKLAIRVGTGRDPTFKAGAMLRVVPETLWPSDDWVEVHIVRSEEDDGTMKVYLDPDPRTGQEPDPDDPFFADTLSGFKGRTRSGAELWIGGWGAKAQQFEVEVKDVRVVRRKQ
jgi:tetratricopeptide (TPR) repeat protein